MVAITRSVLALLALPVFGALAAEPAVDVDVDVDAEEAAAAQTPDLKINIATEFPDVDAIFGVKLFNGQTTHATVNVTNHESSPIRVSIIGGILSTTQPLPEGAPPSAAVFANLTAVSYDHTKLNILEPGETKGFPYNFKLDLQPREVQLDLQAVIANAAGQVFQVEAYHGLVAIVDPPVNIFDPQIIFLYVFLTGAFGGTLFFVYKTWIAALFPQAKRPATGRKARKAAGVAETAAADALSGNESTGAGTGTDEFDPNWIPSHHINRPVAKRVSKGSSGKKKVSE